MATKGAVDTPDRLRCCFRRPEDRFQDGTAPKDPRAKGLGMPHRRRLRRTMSMAAQAASHPSSICGVEEENRPGNWGGLL